MNFTREPIIETVITPREGCKLLVRSSKGASQEDYFVDAVEVVSFGHSFFFRSQERPKSFLVPVSDYEILESKETRVVIKNASADHAIKIGGGRDAPPQEQPRDQTLADSRPAPDRQQGQDRKRDRRGRRRRGRDRHHDQQPQEQQNGPVEPRDDYDRNADGQRREHRPDAHQERGRHPRPEREDFVPTQEGSEEVKAPSFISKLFPPPQTLIKETLSRYKPAEDDISDEEIPDLPTKKEIEDDNEE